MSEKAPQTINLVLNLGPRGSIVEFNLSEMSTNELEQNPDYIAYKCSENILGVRLSACDSCRQPIKINIFSMKNKNELELQVVNESDSEDFPEGTMEEDGNYWRTGGSSKSFVHGDPLNIKLEPISQKISAPKNSVFDQSSNQCNCGLKFISQQYLNKHIALTHNGIVPAMENPEEPKIKQVKPSPDTSKFIKCPHCGQSYNHRQRLKYHLKIGCYGRVDADGNHVCKGCNKSYKTRITLSKHIRKTPECRNAGIRKIFIYSCECGLEFNKVKDRNDHCVATRHRKGGRKSFNAPEGSTNPEVGTNELLECPYCCRKFKYKKRLAIHLNNGCQEKMENDARLESDSKEKVDDHVT